MHAYKQMYLPVTACTNKQTWVGTPNVEWTTSTSANNSSTIRCKRWWCDNDNVHHRHWLVHHKQYLLSLLALHGPTTGSILFICGCLISDFRNFQIGEISLCPTAHKVRSAFVVVEVKCLKTPSHNYLKRSFRIFHGSNFFHPFVHTFFSVVACRVK